MAGTTGLEPAASAVTALREMVLQQITRHAGTAKRRASHIRHAKLCWEFLGKTALNATLHG